MKGNAWLMGYVIFALVAIGGAGFFFFQGKSSYDEAFNGWDRLSSKIEKLEEEVPYPSEENETELQGSVEAYEAKVKGLYDSLARYQKPLNEQISDSDFTTQVLSTKVGEFTAAAAEANFEVVNPEEFYLAMGQYRASFPRPKMVPMLDYQLGAIDHLLRTLVDSGATKLWAVTREELPFENDASNVDATGIIGGQVVQKYPVTLRFQASHAAFQKFVNSVANDENYFFIVRLLRVENSSPEGPNLVGDGEGGQVGPKFVNADGDPAPQELIDATNSTAATFDELVTAMAEQGYQVQRQDARIIFGQEVLDVFAVIDLVRFVSPEEAAAAAAANDQGNEKKGPPRRN